MRLSVQFDAEVFDTHINVGNAGVQQIAGRNVELFYKREIPLAEDLQKFMKARNITKAIAVPQFNSHMDVPFAEYNPIAVNAAEKFTNVFAGLWVNPAKTESTLSAINAYRTNPQLKVIKLHPHSWSAKITMDPKTWPADFKKSMEHIIDFAKDRRLVIQINTGIGQADVKEFVPFVKEYGERLKIQFCHGGFYLEGVINFVYHFAEWVRRGYDFYTDTSVSLSFALPFMINEFKESAPAALERVLFASDEPWGNYEATLAMIRSLKIDRDLKHKILFDNANHLFCPKTLK